MEQISVGESVIHVTKLSVHCGGGAILLSRDSRCHFTGTILWNVLQWGGLAWQLWVLWKKNEIPMEEELPHDTTWYSTCATQTFYFSSMLPWPRVSQKHPKFARSWLGTTWDKFSVFVRTAHECLFATVTSPNLPDVSKITKKSRGICFFVDLAVLVSCLSCDYAHVLKLDPLKAYATVRYLYATCTQLFGWSYATVR